MHNKLKSIIGICSYWKWYTHFISRYLLWGLWNASIDLVDLFIKASGLKVNYQKSNLLPINVPPEDIQNLFAILGCAPGQFHFTYLGVSLSYSKPRMEHFMYLITRIQQRHNVCSQFLSYDGRLLMVNAILSSLTTFVMSCLLLYKGIIEQLDK